jgi:hypothetical protein
MNELRWKTGEVCRVGDVVEWPDCDIESAMQNEVEFIRYECLALGQKRVLLKDPEGAACDEYALPPCEYCLRRRAGEVADRDRARYEYHDGDPSALEFFQGWEMIVVTPPLVFRRLRQPAAPAKPRQRMKANRIFTEDPLHGVEHDEKDTCHSPPACEPVDQAAPTFEAVVWSVEALDGGSLLSKGPASVVKAYVGNGHGGYTIAAFCKTREDAEGLAQSYRDRGDICLCGGYHLNPMHLGKPLPFAVAVKVKVTK